jgi:glycosyltransferase involved in cell wall biosynthesis
MGKQIGFVSTRLAGIDGVSLEANKWACVLQRSGHHCFWFAGKLDKASSQSACIPEAHFKHPQIEWIYRSVIGHNGRPPSVTEMIHRLRYRLKIALQEFIERFKIDLIIIENAFAIPLNIPLGMALAELISENRFPAIAHHHDFYWERDSFCVNGIDEYLGMAFPPKLPSVEHVVINSAARIELARRRGILATVIPNVLDFANPPQPRDNSNGSFLKMFGLGPDDKTILQPTRIIKRKGIEHAVALVKALPHPAFKLVVSHEAGDEGFAYSDWLKAHARENGVDLRLAGCPVCSPFRGNGAPKNGCSLWSVYRHADFVTFPSLHEGFGNALLEAIYFRKPLLVNRYTNFVKDIEPKGFDLVTMDGYITPETVHSVAAILESPARRRQMVDTNYNIAARHYSYEILSARLNAIVAQLPGDLQNRPR